MARAFVEMARYKLTAKDDQERTLVWCGPKDKWCLESELTMLSANLKLYGSEAMVKRALGQVDCSGVYHAHWGLFHSAEA